MALNSLNHTQLSNEFLDKYINELSGNAIKIFLVITRKTVGWHKTTDRISQSQFETLTGLTVNTIKEAIKELIDWDLINQELTELGYVYEIKYNEGVSNSDSDGYQTLIVQNKYKINKQNKTKENTNDKYKNPVYNSAVKKWDELYYKLTGHNYIWKGHDKTILWNLIKENPSNVLNKIDLYYAGDYWFAKNKEIKFFVNNYNSIISENYVLNIKED